MQSTTIEEEDSQLLIEDARDRENGDCLSKSRWPLIVELVGSCRCVYRLRTRKIGDDYKNQRSDL